MRYEILSQDELLELKTFWEAYYRKHPDSGKALLETAKAMRYLNEDLKSVTEVLEQALALDPDNAEAAAYLGFILACKYDSPDYRRGIELMEQSLKMDETLVHPNYNLWTHYLKTGQYRKAEEQLFEIYRKGDIPSPLLDYGYNMLVSVDREGILITNGDNDTYPPVLLQVVKGIRPDVTVVNQSLLQTPWYTRYLRDHYGKLPIRYDDETIEKMSKEKGPRYNDAMIMHIIEEANKCGRPVYFAVTLASMRDQEHHLALEGLVYRWSLEEYDEVGTLNIERCEMNLDERYRMDSLTDWLFDWEENPAIKNIMKNYIALYLMRAKAYQKKGQLESCRKALREAIRISESTGNTDMEQKLEAYSKTLCTPSD
jgi:tetratricopeptide (TPR) repeat protein